MATSRVTMPRGIRRILERDPTQMLIDQLELVQLELRSDDFIRHVRRVLRRTKARTGAGWVHVTDAQITCQRLLAGALLGVPLPRRFVPAESRRIMDNGTMMHLRWQAYFLALPKPFKVRVAHVLKRWPLVGEADIDIRHPELGNWVIELKSMEGFQFRNLSSPPPQHQHQLNCYMNMRGDRCKGQFWYESKNNQKLKTFLKEADFAAWREVWGRVGEAANGLLAGALPAHCEACPDVTFCDGIQLSEEALAIIAEQRKANYA